MGISNRTASLERKITHLLGERKTKAAHIAKTERLYDELPALRERVSRIDELVFYCEEIIKDDHPEWTPDHLEAARAFVHKIPIKFGSATKLALDVLRTAEEPMTIREIATEVLRREGHGDADRITIDMVTSAIGNQFRKRKRPYLANDWETPAHWWVIRPE